MGGMAMANSRDASGTAWQPAVTAHRGLHVMQGPWTVMTHATLNLVHDDQSGPRGSAAASSSGMVMSMATRHVGEGQLQLRAMLSPRPAMGKRGYPLLLATARTADGCTPLIDRQHPHDLFMSSRRATTIGSAAGPDSSTWPAGRAGGSGLRPSCTACRSWTVRSADQPPLAGLHPHRLGVVTAGYILGDWKAECRASRAASRTSTAGTSKARSWTRRRPLVVEPAPSWSLQGSSWRTRRARTAGAGGRPGEVVSERDLLPPVFEAGSVVDDRGLGPAHRHA
jgi:hypothetical protein